MKEMIGRKKYKIYALSIETHNDDESIKNMETSMWLGSLVSEDSKESDKSLYFYTIDGLLEKLNELTTKSRKHNKTAQCSNVCIYIHNLAFVWSFMLPVILKHGYEHKDEIDKEDSKVFNSISNSSVSSVWGITIKTNKDNGTVIFRDLKKMFPQPLPAVAESFNLDIDSGTMDYKKNRLHDYKITKEDRHYDFSNAMIVMRILEHMKGDKAFWQTCSSSSYSCRKMISSAYGNDIKPMRKYRESYPDLRSDETAFLRQSVAGGLAYSPDRYLFTDVSKAIHIDAHQMYPSMAYKNIFPYGYGTYFKGKPTDTFTCMNCIRIKISYVGVRLHSIVSLINIDCIEDYEMVVWDFELPTMFKCYVDLKVEYIDGFAYKTKLLPWRNFYKSNYDKRLVSRKKKDNFGVFYYKMLNNGGIGKTLEKPYVNKNINTVDFNGVITSDVADNEDNVNCKYTYVPVGSAINAYAKVELIETAFKFGYENIIHMDTDSLFIVDSPNARKVLKTLPLEDYLGNWGIEDMIKKMSTTGSKRYKTENYEGKVDIKISGVNGIKKDVSFDDVNILDSSWDVKRVYRCKGGTIMGLQHKTLGVALTKQHLLEKENEDDNKR